MFERIFVKKSLKQELSCGVIRAFNWNLKEKCQISNVREYKISMNRKPQQKITMKLVSLTCWITTLPKQNKAKKHFKIIFFPSYLREISLLEITIMAW